MESLLPRLALDLGHPAPGQWGALFGVPVDELHLEIGFGGGEHLTAEAIAHPRIGFIGCEPFLNGMASALAAIEAHGLPNVRLHFGHALDVIDWLPDASLTRIDMLYPDPWSKRRHWKRRFITEERLSRIARVLKPGGMFRFATDSADYATWTLWRFLRSAAFAWTAERADDWRRPWPEFAGTRYEAKAIQEGRHPCYLLFRRM